MEQEVPGYIIESITNLPPLPTVVDRLLDLAHQENLNFRKLSDLVSTDPTLTARILRAANSAMYGASVPIQTVHQATVYLGEDTIINLALGVSVLGMQKKFRHEWPLGNEAFWRHNIGVASAARDLAKLKNIDNPDQLFVAGLIHDIGKMVLFQHYEDKYADLLMVARETGHPLHELEKEHFDTDHSVAGQALCRQWNIPENLIQAVSNHHEGPYETASEVGQIVRTANTLVKILQVGDGGNPCIFPEDFKRVLEMKGPNESVHEFLWDHLDAIMASEAVLNGSIEDEEQIQVDNYLHVAIEHQEQDPLLDLALIGLQYNSLPLPEQPFPGNDDDEDEETDTMLLGDVLTDKTFSEEETALFEEAGIHILKYRPPRIQSKDGQSINYGGYCDWLKKTIASPQFKEEKIEEKDLYKMLEGRLF